MTALTRGPLPARVYWTRRVLVLGTVFLLVFGVARMVGGAGQEEQAVQVSGTPTSAPSEAPTGTPAGTAAADQEDRAKKKRKKNGKPAEPVLAEPDGPCVDQDVAVTPTVERAVGGRSVRIALELRTIEDEACTWRVSPESLQLKITSGSDEIWSSRQCPHSVRTRDVVVRSAVTSKVAVRWSGRRSDEECSRYTDWALPGWYHVTAAALAGEPSDVQFELVAPERPVITQTVPAEPRQGKKRNRDAGNGGSSNGGQDRDRKTEPKPKHR